MKNYAIIFALLLLSLASCGPWPDEEKEMFHSTCMDDAKERGMTDEQAQKMCDCRLEKMMKKYPDVEDALTNIDKIMNDPEIQQCQQDALK